MLTSHSPRMLQRDTPRGRRPAVLFVDEDGWDCFFQLASGLRRAGFRTIRVTTSAPSRAASLLCFNRTVRLGSSSDLVSLSEILEGDDVVDVQVVEALAIQTYEGLAAVPNVEFSANWARRMDVVDKLVVSRRLRAAGFCVPDVVPAPVASAQDVIEELGLPVGTSPGSQAVVEVRRSSVRSQIYRACCPTMGVTTTRTSSSATSRGGACRSAASSAGTRQASSPRTRRCAVSSTWVRAASC